MRASNNGLHRFLRDVTNNAIRRIIFFLSRRYTQAVQNAESERHRLTSLARSIDRSIAYGN